MSKHYNIVRKSMQMTEKFYNVLWLGKNACQYRFGSPTPWPGLEYQRDITTPRRQQKILLSTVCTILSLREQLLRGQELISRAPRSVSMMSRWYRGLARGRGCRTYIGTHSCSTKTHCKIFFVTCIAFLTML